MNKSRQLVSVTISPVTIEMGTRDKADQQYYVSVKKPMHTNTTLCALLDDAVDIFADELHALLKGRITYMSADDKVREKISIALAAKMAVGGLLS